MSGVRALVSLSVVFVFAVVVVVVLVAVVAVVFVFAGAVSVCLVLALGGWPVVFWILRGLMVSRYLHRSMKRFTDIL